MRSVYHRAEVRSCDGAAEPIVSIRVGRFAVTRFPETGDWVFTRLGLRRGEGNQLESFSRPEAELTRREAFLRARQRWPKTTSEVRHGQ